MNTEHSLFERAAIYALLARMFSYPLTTDELEAVAGLSVDESSGEASALGAPLAQMQAAMSLDYPVLVETLNREATRLFEGPGQPVAPPFGSFYLNERRLMGPEAVDVRRAYLAAQLLPDQGGLMPPDHIALELGFIAALAGSESPEALASARDFLVQHLLSWIPMWCDDVARAKPHPFYSGLVALTQAALASDLVWLNGTFTELAPEVVGA
jgi:TorA maturation chaperone TorD